MKNIICSRVKIDAGRGGISQGIGHEVRKMVTIGSGAFREIKVACLFNYAINEKFSDIRYSYVI